MATESIATKRSNIGISVLYRQSGKVRIKDGSDELRIPDNNGRKFWKVSIRDMWDKEVVCARTWATSDEAEKIATDWQNGLLMANPGMLLSWSITRIPGDPDNEYETNNL
jgi:hypothetical protein